MVSYPTSSSASGIWQLGDISLFIQDDAWPDATFERAVFGGGAAPGNSNIIDYITVSSLGNATDFGDLTVALGSMNSGENSSKTRGIFGGGYNAGVGNNNTVNFITFASTGNATDFGDNIIAVRGGSQLSSSTRGINGGGVAPGAPGASAEVLNVISFITIASAGNYADFGDMAIHSGQRAGFGNATIGLFAGGYSIPGGPGDLRPSVNNIDNFTIATLGNASDFGDLNNATRLNAAFSSTIRGIISQGGVSPAGTALNVIDFVTIASAGNASDFGDLSANWSGFGGGVDNNIRGVFAGGQVGPASTNILEYVTIATTGNTADFGDLTIIRRGMSSASNNKASNR